MNYQVTIVDTLGQSSTKH